jgi:hypothetical protein
MYFSCKLAAAQAVYIKYQRTLPTTLFPAPPNSANSSAVTADATTLPTRTTRIPCKVAAAVAPLLLLCHQPVSHSTHLIVVCIKQHQLWAPTLSAAVQSSTHKAVCVSAGTCATSTAYIGLCWASHAMCCSTVPSSTCKQYMSAQYLQCIPN